MASGTRLPSIFARAKIEETAGGPHTCTSESTVAEVVTPSATVLLPHATARSRAGMRVCLVTSEYLGVSEYIGGLGVRYATLAPALARAGVDLHVLTYGQGPDRIFERDGVCIHAIGRPPNSDQHVWEELRWDRIVDRSLRRVPSLDLVYAPEWRGSLARYALRRDRPAVVTNLTTSLAQVLAIDPGPSRSTLQPAFRWMIQHRLERGQAERSDGLVAVSRAILASSRTLWNIDAVPSATLSNQIDLERVLPLVERDLPPGFPQQGPVVAYSGRLEVRKGVIVLLEAMRRVWNTRPEVQLVMLGGDAPLDGIPMSHLLRERAGPHARRLHVLGHLSHEQLIPALSRADVVALPSLWEAFGNAALEAMAVGRPVVVTTGSGYDDFCRQGENALMVPPKDAQTLSEALLRLLEDEDLRRRLGQTAALDARQYSADPSARRHRDFFDGVVAARRDRRSVSARSRAR